MSDQPTHDRIEAAARVLSQSWNRLHANESLGRQRMLARALADAGLLTKDAGDAEHCAEAAEAEADRLRGQVQRVIDDNYHADTCGSVLSPSEEYPCSCWQADLHAALDGDSGGA